MIPQHKLEGKSQCQSWAGDPIKTRCPQPCYGESPFCYYHDKKHREIIGPWQWANNQGAGHNLTSDKVKEHNLQIRCIDDISNFYYIGDGRTLRGCYGPKRCKDR